MRKYLLLPFVIALFGCATNPPTPDPVVTASCQTACANLAAIECPEGRDPLCVDVCQSAQTAKLTNLKLDCLASAASKEAVRACGSVDCP